MEVTSRPYFDVNSENSNLFLGTRDSKQLEEQSKVKLVIDKSFMVIPRIKPIKKLQKDMIWTAPLCSPMAFKRYIDNPSSIQDATSRTSTKIIQQTPSSLNRHEMPHNLTFDRNIRMNYLEKID